MPAATKVTLRELRTWVSRAFEGRARVTEPYGASDHWGVCEVTVTIDEKRSIAFVSTTRADARRLARETLIDLAEARLCRAK